MKAKEKTRKALSMNGSPRIQLERAPLAEQSSNHVSVVVSVGTSPFPHSRLMQLNSHDIATAAADRVRVLIAEGHELQAETEQQQAAARATLEAQATASARRAAAEARQVEAIYRWATASATRTAQAPSPMRNRASVVTPSPLTFGSAMASPAFRGNGGGRRSSASECGGRRSSASECGGVGAVSDSGKIMPLPGLISPSRAHLAEVAHICRQLESWPIDAPREPRLDRLLRRLHALRREVANGPDETSEVDCGREPHLPKENAFREGIDKLGGEDLSKERLSNLFGGGTPLENGASEPEPAAPKTPFTPQVRLPSSGMLDAKDGEPPVRSMLPLLAELAVAAAAAAAVSPMADDPIVRAAVRATELAVLQTALGSRHSLSLSNEPSPSGETLRASIDASTTLGAPIFGNSTTLCMPRSNASEGSVGSGLAVSNEAEALAQAGRVAHAVCQLHCALRSPRALDGCVDQRVSMTVTSGCTMLPEAEETSNHALETALLPEAAGRSKTHPADDGPSFVQTGEPNGLALAARTMQERLAQVETLCARQAEQLEALREQATAQLCSQIEAAAADATVLAQPSASSQPLDVFTLFDVDRTGRITLANLRHVATMLGMPVDDHTLQRMISKADVNGDGSVSRCEFARLFESPAANPNLDSSDLFDPAAATVDGAAVLCTPPALRESDSLHAGVSSAAGTAGARDDAMRSACLLPPWVPLALPALLLLLLSSMWLLCWLGSRWIWRSLGSPNEVLPSAAVGEVGNPSLGLEPRPPFALQRPLAWVMSVAGSKLARLGRELNKASWARMLQTRCSVSWAHDGAAVAAESERQRIAHFLRQLGALDGWPRGMDRMPAEQPPIRLSQAILEMYGRRLE